MKPFNPEEAPIYAKNCLALNSVISISVTLKRETVKGDIVFK